jgi:hypothetical protein
LLESSISIGPRRTWSGFKKAAGSVELAVLLLVSAVLFKDILAHFYIEDAIIMGILSLFLIIGGMQLKIRSYFLVGTGTLLLNLFLQTREFWKSVPWWVYLLAAGLILIITASLNEMQKNGKSGRIKDKIQSFIDRFKKWK